MPATQVGGKTDSRTRSSAARQIAPAGLKLLPTMAKECRKYGLALIVASQEARDFDSGLFAAIANYLVLRVTDADARAMACNVEPSDRERRLADRLKNLPKFEALFFADGQRLPAALRLAGPI